MQKQFIQTQNLKITDYVEKVFDPEDPILKSVRDRAEEGGLPPIHVGKMDGLHLEVLTRMSGAKKAVEIGTLAGYSAICIARGMGKAGKLYAFELKRSYATIAEQSFKEAGVADQISVIVGPALQNLSQVTDQGPFDLVFLDADKTGYPDYLDWAWKNLKPGGLVIADNTFGWGLIADEKFESTDDQASIDALRKFNWTMSQSGKFRSTILPTGEGLTIGVKIG